MDESSINPKLIFVYNAESGMFNALTDLAHKTLSPETYSCNLCALTYSTFGMRREWKGFLENLDLSFEFLHADEMREIYQANGAPLPAVFIKEDEKLRVLIEAAEINECRTLGELKHLIGEKLRR